MSKVPYKITDEFSEYYGETVFVPRDVVLRFNAAKALLQDEESTLQNSIRSYFYEVEFIGQLKLSLAHLRDNPSRSDKTKFLTSRGWHMDDISTFSKNHDVLKMHVAFEEELVIFEEEIKTRNSNLNV